MPLQAEFKLIRLAWGMTKYLTHPPRSRYDQNAKQANRSEDLAASLARWRLIMAWPRHVPIWSTRPIAPHRCFGSTRFGRQLIC
jgi:hypothetical protein